MKKPSRSIIILFILCFISPPFYSFAADSVAPVFTTQGQLQQAIDEKNKELAALNDKINQIQQDLGTVQTQGQSLQQELKKADAGISQVNLSIKSSELNIQKLGLEIESLKYNITDTQSQISAKKDAIAKLLEELQQKDTETILTTFLRNKSLAESLNEVQGIVDVNSGLSENIKSLQSLNQQLSDNLAASSARKADLELEDKNLINRQQILKNQKADKQTLLVQTKNQEKNYQALLIKLQKDQASLQSDIDDAEAKLRASFNPDLLPAKRSGVISWPIKLTKDGGIGVITQGYGELNKIYHSGWHNGIDIAVPIGTPVFAADDGRVVDAGSNDKSSWQKFQYGRHVIINHPDNLSTLYAHLSLIIVKYGQIVKRGELIGYSGNSGLVYSTSGGNGAHLHFGVYWTPRMQILNADGLDNYYKKEFGLTKNYDFPGEVPVGVTVDPLDYL
ncbi:MAG: peptidoglycan DD-metalloendopeptidase family protein [Patescibacteria group bacterium]|nr:peptidoglycan DD-metalloendopeptidase family protein [Patescibacteria group bacterium]